MVERRSIFSPDSLGLLETKLGCDRVHAHACGPTPAGEGADHRTSRPPLARCTSRALSSTSASTVLETMIEPEPFAPSDGRRV